MTFTYWGTELEYETGSYNDAARNERAVEVPIAWQFIVEHAPMIEHVRGLELGDVMGHYFTHSFTTIDLDPAADALHVDILGDTPLRDDFNLVVSISTVEHVHADTRDGPLRAIQRLRGLLAPGGAMLVTAAVGAHDRLDDWIMGTPFGAMPSRPDRECTLVRNGDGWTQTPELEWRVYGPAWANSVWIGEWHG